MQEIQIVPTGVDLGGTKTADVAIEFTPAFNTINQKWWCIFQNTDRTCSHSVLRFAGNNGVFVEHIVPKSKEEVIKEFLDSLERPDDENI